MSAVYVTRITLGGTEYVDSYAPASFGIDADGRLRVYESGGVRAIYDRGVWRMARVGMVQAPPADAGSEGMPEPAYPERSR